MPTPQLDVSKARELCTASEWALVSASTRGNIRNLSEAQLRKHVEQSRKLRDKWKDQSTRQRRAVQKSQRGRATDKASRSRKKSELFSAVLSRFVEQLATRFGKDVVGGSSAHRSSKPQRTQGHKRQRSQVKEQMSQERTASAPAKSKPASKPKASKPEKSEQELTNQTQPPAKSGAADVKPANRPPLLSAANNKGLTPNRIRQRKANTAAKLGKVQESGLKSRIRGHVSARGKRNQVRRDSRN